MREGGVVRLAEFQGTQPQLRLERFFVGQTFAYGLFEDRFGRVRRQFDVTIEGRLEGDVLVLDEEFRYMDGAREHRHWRISRVGEHGYSGEAAGVVGRAGGAVAGRALNWRYRYDLAVGRRTVRVDFDDWMFLHDERHLVNRATVSKWGLRLGTVWLFFERASD